MVKYMNIEPQIPNLLKVLPSTVHKNSLLNNMNFCLNTLRISVPPLACFSFICDLVWTVTVTANCTQAICVFRLFKNKWSHFL
jgi:hypothetical protein